MPYLDGHKCEPNKDTKNLQVTFFLKKLLTLFVQNPPVAEKSFKHIIYQLHLTSLK